MNNTNTGNLIRELRKEKSMTQKELADLLNITDRAVSKWERGLCAPDISLLEPLAVILNVNVSDLISGEHDPKKFKAMEIYTILMELNRKMIFGEEISDAEKSKAVSFFLDGICEKDEIVKYKKRMGVNTEADNIYPNYYIPPYDGNKKLRLIQGYLPKTNILYANHYELEIIRLLYIFAPENKTVNEMARNTLQRLKRTCFGNSCPQGECLATGISVLRFLAVICPDNIDWIEKLCTPLGELFLSFGQGQASIKQSVPLSYLLMAFTDINTEKTRTLIKRKQEWLLNLLRRGWITGKLSNGKISEGDTYNLMGKYIIRNAIGILPEFKDVSKYEIYVNDKDKRCYCNI